METYHEYSPEVSCRTTKVFLVPCFYIPPNIGTLYLESLSVDNRTPSLDQTIKLSVITRCNGGPCSAEIIGYYRSTDPTINHGDTRIGNKSVPQLSEGGSNLYDIEIKVENSGTHYYGACIGNRCTAGTKVEVIPPSPSAGILSLKSFSVDATTPRSGQSIRLSVTAHCTGGPCPANTIYYYRASNAAFTADVTQIGSSSNVRQLNNGQSDNTLSTTDTTPNVESAQTYYYGACIGNGCTPTVSHTQTVTINPKPPGILTLRNFDASPKTATSGNTITLSITAHCTGELCPANTIYYYRASNAAFTADVTQIGSSSNVRQLNNGQSDNTPSKTDTAPKVESTQIYYYGACIGNGCTPTVSHTQTVTVNPQPGTLTLRNFDANPNTITSGDTITLSVTAHCTGGPCSADIIYYYRASNAAFTADVTPIGSSSNVRQLNNGQSDNTPSKTDTAPKVESTQIYYYGACIGNGCTPTASHTQTVTVNPQPGTLTLQNFDANPNIATSGDTITLSVTAHCTGELCPANTIHYYRASNAAFTADVTPIGSSSNVRQLNNGQSDNTPSKTDTAPKVESTQIYYYGACIGNGCTPTVSHAETVTVNPQPGTLTLRNFDANPNTVTSGDTITLSVTAHCTGGPCSADIIYYYRASNAAFTADVTPIGSSSNVRQLNNGRSDNTLSTTDTIPNVGSAQTYYYGACIGNGCTPTVSHAESVIVNPQPGTLTLQNFDANPNTATSGNTITLSVTAHCRGGPCPANTIYYYRASNAAFTADVTPIGSSSNVRQLNNGQSDNTLSTTDTIPNVGSAQTYYYGACIGNGCTPTVSHAETVTVNPQPGTLTLRNFDANPNTVTSGDTITLSVTAHCTGGPCSADIIYYYRASNAAFSNDVTQIGSSSNVRQLNNGRSDNTLSTTDTIPNVGSAQTYYYGACIGNGCTPTVSHAETVTVNPQPGTLTLRNFDANPNTVTSGDTITLSVTAHCTGGPCSADIIYYYRASNAAFSNDVTQIDNSNVRPLNNGRSDNTLSTTDTAPNVGSAQTYYYGACIGNGCTPTVSHAESVIVNPQPGTPTLQNFDANPNTATSGDTITLSATARCIGGPCDSFTIYYYRAERSSFRPKKEIDSRNVGALDDGERETKKVRANAPDVDSSDNYYYGACIGNGCTPTASHAESVIVNPQPGTPTLQNFDANPNTATSGDTITLSATARCIGGPCDPFTIYYYRAERSSFRPKKEIDSRNVGALDDGEREIKKVRANAPDVGSSDNYYYGACIENNGCTPREYDSVEVIPPGTLSIVSFTVDDDEPEKGQKLEFSITVRCSGGRCSPQLVTLIRTAESAALEGETHSLDETQELQDGGQDTMKVSINAPNVAGTYTYYGCTVGRNSVCMILSITIDSRGVLSPTRTIDSSVTASHFFTTNSFYMNDYTPSHGQKVKVAVNLQCTGGPCYGVTVRFFQSDDSIRSPARDNRIANIPIEDAESQYKYDENEEISIWFSGNPLTITRGGYYYACVDDGEGYNIEEDCSDTRRVTIQ